MNEVVKGAPAVVFGLEFVDPYLAALAVRSSYMPQLREGILAIDGGQLDFYGLAGAELDLKIRGFVGAVGRLDEHLRLHGYPDPPFTLARRPSPSLGIRRASREVAKTPRRGFYEALASALSWADVHLDALAAIVPAAHAFAQFQAETEASVKDMLRRLADSGE